MGAAKKVVIDRNWHRSDLKTIPVRRISRFEKIEVTKSEDLPELMTTRQAAEFLKRHVKTIEEWRKEGSLRFIKVRGRYFTTPEYIADFLENEQSKNG